MFSSASQGREWREGTLGTGCVHVRVRRKKRGQVSEKNQIWARKGKGGCHMGDQCGRRSRDQGKQCWEYSKYDSVYMTPQILPRDQEQSYLVLPEAKCWSRKSSVAAKPREAAQPPWSLLPPGITVPWYLRHQLSKGGGSQVPSLPPELRTRWPGTQTPYCFTATSALTAALKTPFRMTNVKRQSSFPAFENLQ